MNVPQNTVAFVRLRILSRHFGAPCRTRNRPRAGVASRVGKRLGSHKSSGRTSRRVRIIQARKKTIRALRITIHANRTTIAFQLLWFVLLRSCYSPSYCNQVLPVVLPAAMRTDVLPACLLRTGKLPSPFTRSKLAITRLH